MKKNLNTYNEVNFTEPHLPHANEEFLRAKQIHAPDGILPISRSTFLDYVARGIIEKPIKLGPRISCWRRSGILAFIDKMEAK
jgi:predicted DNA-binding transcriptional regulator AlpA